MLPVIRDPRSSQGQALIGDPGRLSLFLSLLLPKGDLSCVKDRRKPSFSQDEPLRQAFDVQRLMTT